MTKVISEQEVDNIELVVIPRSTQAAAKDSLSGCSPARRSPRVSCPPVSVLSATTWNRRSGCGCRATRPATHLALHYCHRGGEANPRNLEALIGTSGSELIEQAGGYTGEAARLIMGGDDGFYAAPDKVPIVKASNCLLAASTQGGTRSGIGDCLHPLRQVRRVCPVSLLPQQMYWYARAKDLENQSTTCLTASNAAAVRTSVRRIFRWCSIPFRQKMLDQGGKRRRELARMRHEAKLARLARLEAEKLRGRRRKSRACKERLHEQRDQTQPVIPKGSHRGSSEARAEKKRDLPRRVSNHKTRIISPTPSAGRCNRRTPAEKPLVMATLDRPVNNRTADRCNSPPLPHHIRTDLTASLLPCYG